MSDPVEVLIAAAPARYRVVLAVAFLMGVSGLFIGGQTMGINDTVKSHDTRINTLESSDLRRSSDIATITTTLARIEQKLDDRLPDSKEKR